MAESHGDGSIAPRRSLNGPILPPPPPELAEKDAKREAEEAASRRAAAQRQAEKETRQAEKQAKRQAAANEKAAQKEAADVPAGQKHAAHNKGPTHAKGLRGLVSRETKSGDPAGDSSSTSGDSSTGSSSSTSAGTTTDTSKLSRVGPAVAGAAATASGSKSSQARTTTKKQREAPRRTRRARLRLVQVDAWSVMKTAFLLSIALGIMLVVAVSIIWSVLGAAGVWDSINSIVQQSVGGDTGTPFDIEQYVGTSRVLGFTMIVAVLDVVLITAIATLGAFLYNLSAALLGGIEVTLAEDA